MRNQTIKTFKDKHFIALIAIPGFPLTRFRTEPKLLQVILYEYQLLDKVKWGVNYSQSSQFAKLFNSVQGKLLIDNMKKSCSDYRR